MTEREQLRIAETKKRKLLQEGYRCEVCGEPVTPWTMQLAHRIPKSKMNLRKYGKEVIHHDLNLAVTCSLQCNSAVIIHGIDEQKLVNQIEEVL